MKFLRIKGLMILICALFSIQASALKAYFDYRVYDVPGQGPYADFITSFDGRSLALAAGDSGFFHSTVELTLIVSQNDKIFDYRKTNVYGPMVEKGAPSDFMSLERFALPNGNYELEIQIKDIFDPLSKVDNLFQEIVINNLSEGTFYSDIEFISAYAPSSDVNAFTKSGIDMLPYVSSFFPASLDVIIFYTEIYNTDKYFGTGSAFVSTVCITDPLNRELEDCKRIKREKSAPVVPVFQTVDISELPSGDYKIRLEVRDKDNNVVTTRERNFTRTNYLEEATNPDSMVRVAPDLVRGSFASLYTDRDSLYNILQAHHPIAKSVERTTLDNTLTGADLQTLQSFFFSFWYNRHPENPEAAWREYEKELAMVQSNFGTRVKKGWQTERGRVYLQYGPPNTRVIRHNDPDYWPFEIWHYYETNSGLHNKRFLFYNTALNNDFELLHSDVPNEVQNFDWKNLVRTRRGNDPSTTQRLGTNQRQDTFSQDELENLWYTPH